jgi:hypothetical protein
MDKRISNDQITIKKWLKEFVVLETIKDIGTSIEK